MMFVRLQMGLNQRFRANECEMTFILKNHLRDQFSTSDFVWELINEINGLNLVVVV